MIKIAVVEDDDGTADDLTEMLCRFGEEQGVAIRVRADAPSDFRVNRISASGRTCRKRNDCTDDRSES